MKNSDGRIAVLVDDLRASAGARQGNGTGSTNVFQTPDDDASYAWHALIGEHGAVETHALTVGDPYPIVVATVVQGDNGRWLITAHQHLDPVRHQRAHARTLAQARKIAETLTSAECARLSNHRRYRRKARAAD